MSRLFTVIAVTALLAGCDSSNPFDDTDVVVDPDPAPVIDPENPVSPNGIPAALTGGNLESVEYDPSAGTLSVDMAALDRNDEEIPLESYVPNAALTALAPGYQVFSYQDDALDRMFVAIVAQDTSGSVVGAVVMDGGQFNKFFGGGFYATDGSYTPGSAANDTGLVSYAGNYAALTNIIAEGDQLMTPNGSPDDSILPSQPGQITGSIFINADFGDNTINGAIYDRALVNVGPTVVGIPDVVLTPTAITDAGSFFGVVENDEQDAVGNYGGTFGGTEAAGVAGVTNLEGDWLPNVEDEAEFGVFVLSQCGQPGEAAICNDIPVNP